MGVGELFPGWPATTGVDGPRPFDPDDDARQWALDFHFPRGLTPLGLTTFAVAYVAATAEAARSLGVPGSDGFSVRTVGPHVYISGRVPEDDEGADRARRFAARVEERVATFPARWAATVAALDEQAARLLSAPLPDDDAGLHAWLDEAVAHEATAWYAHFAEMYAVLGGHVAYRATVAELGVPADIADACLLGVPTRTSAADAALLELAEACRERAVADASDVLADAALAEQVRAYVAAHGRRAEGVADVALPSWEEDPGGIVARAIAIARFGAKRPDAEERAQRRAIAREQALSLATDPGAFAAALARAERANWVWWNEEHNAAIDLRASLPLRRVARAIGARYLDGPDGALLCAVDELRSVLRGAPAPPAPLLAERHAWLDTWRARRTELPPVRGDLSVAMPHDPVVEEVFGGLHPPGDHRCLYGLGVSSGRVVGRVRVVPDAFGLDELEADEVLVCEATSPNWGWAFSLAAAVVCDHGGRTTHAAICAREWALPCVVGVANASRRLRSGDVVEVDGDAGTVKVLHPTAPPTAI